MTAETLVGAVPFAASVLLQSTLILGSGLFLLWAIRGSRPAVRSLWARALLIAVLLNALGTMVKSGRAPSVWNVALPASNLVSYEARPLERGHVGWREAAAPSASRPAVQVEMPRAAALNSNGRVFAALVAVWLGGAVLLLGWLGWCHLQVFMVRLRSQRIREGEVLAMLRGLSAERGLHPPALLQRQGPGGPFLAGFWRPAIFIPSAHRELFDGPSARAILQHELAHLKRRDCAWNGLARALRAVLWPQALLWVLCRQMEEISEEACDAEVLAGGSAPRDYAWFLVELAERLAPARAERTAGVPVVPLYSSLGWRVQAILAARPGNSRISRWLKVPVVVVTGGTVLLALILVAVEAAPLGQAGISGRVRYADGRPARGVRVGAQIQDRSEMRLKLPFGLVPLSIGRLLGTSGITGADGSYSLTGLTTATYNVTVSGESPWTGRATAGPPGWAAAAAEGVQALNGRAVRVQDIVLTRGAIVQGEIRDKISGEPLAGLHVGAHGPHRPMTSAAITFAVTNERGRFAMRVPPGRNYFYSAGPVSNLHCIVDFGNSTPYKTDYGVIRAGGKVYGQSDFVEVSVDGESAPRYSRSGNGGLHAADAIDLKPGETRHVTFRRTPLRMKPGPKGVPTVSLAAKPPHFARR